MVRLSVAAVLALVALCLPVASPAQDVVDPSVALRARRSARPPALGPPPATLDHEVGDVFVMEHDGSNYDENDANGLPNFTPRAALARRFYATHGDNYDFLVVFTNFEFATPGVVAFHNQVRNDTRGIGRPPLDVGPAFGSPGRLKGFIDMAAVSRYRQFPYSLQLGQAGFNRTLGVVGHEVGHQWLSYVHYRDGQGNASIDLLGINDVHWSYLLDSDASVMLGSDWVASGASSFTAARIDDTYSGLDLYLMGLVDAAHTPPFTLLRNPAIDRRQVPLEGATLNAAAEMVTVDQVIAAEGTRSPSSRDTQKEFRLGFIFLTAQGDEPSAEDLAAVERVRSAFADYFFARTRGLALADTTLAETPQPPTAPVPDVDRAVAWLLAHQGADGRWEDSAGTAVRDTAAAVEALSPLADAAAAVGRARDWLQPQAAPTLDHAARAGIALATPALPQPQRTALRDAVLALAASNGGYGLSAGYVPDALDTALALRALAALDPSRSDAAGRAAAALLSLRHASGGFSVVPGGDVSTVVTAEAILALRDWPDLDAAQALVAPALAVLVGRRNPDGGFGESPSTPYATALGLRALMSANGPQAAIDGATAWLQNRQLEDGSWEGGRYPTALTVAALRESAGANLTVPPDGIAITPPAPIEGQVVAVTARVRNAGRRPAGAQHVRLYDGDPALGQVLGETTLGPLEGGQEAPAAFDVDTTGRAGSRTWYVVADAAGEVREVREDDNTGSRGLTVAGLLPNLEVDGFEVTVAPNPPQEGEAAVITATVHNRGARPAGATLLDVSSGDPRFGGRRVGSTPVPPIAAGHDAIVSLTWDTGGQAGPHELFVRADADYRLPESDELDNEAVVAVTVSGPLPPGPDLTVEARARPARLITLPQDQAIDVLVRNLGRDPAASTVALRDSAGAPLGEQAVDVPGRSATLLSFASRIDVSGTHTFVAVADPGGNLAETREDNNTATVVVVDGGDTVDLEVPPDGVVPSALELRAGDVLTVTAVVRNRGTAPLADVPVILAHVRPEGLAELARQPVVLDPGAATTLSFTWPASVVGDAVPLAVVADPFQGLPELSESNNRVDLSIRVLPSSLPNLRVSGADIRFAPDPPQEGGSTSVSVTVRNTGTVPASAFTVRFYRGDPDSGGLALGEVAVSGLGGGATTEPSVIWSPVDTRGITGIFAIADVDGAVNEYDESDNRAFRPVSVLELPDLVLTTADVVLSPGFPRAGAIVTLTATVRNLGQQPSPAAQLRAWEGEVGAPTVVGEAAIPALAPQQAAPVVLSWTPVSPPGAVTLSVLADADGTVREADEGNNLARRTVVVQDADLYVTEPAFSPNGDGVKDTTTLAWRATTPVTVVVSDSQGTRVRTLAAGAPAEGSVSWDGRDARGHLLWDGDYVLTLEGADHAVLGRVGVALDTNRSPIHDAASTGLLSARNLTCRLPAVVGPAWLPAEDEALFIVPAAGAGVEPGLIRVDASGAWSYVGGAPDPWYAQLPGDPARAFVSSAAVSPEGSEALLSDGAGALVAVDLRSGARRPIPGFTSTASWSPDGRWIGLGRSVVDRSGAPAATLPIDAIEWSPDAGFLTDGRRVVRRDGSGERALPLPGSDPVDQVSWLGDGRIFVKTVPDLGFGDDPPQARGFLVDPEADVVTELPWVGRLPPEARLALTANGAKTAYRGAGPANVVREDGSEVRLVDPGPQASGFAVAPHGRVASYTTSAASQPGQACAGPDADTIVLSNLQNLSLELQAARLPANSGLVLRGTAADRQLDDHRLDYATAAAPDVWRPIGPASAAPVIDDVLAVWVPPAPGSYMVRLSALDRAGNTASVTRAVVWDRVPAIANVAQSERLISPTGDGVKDSVRFTYLVVEPTRVDVRIVGPEAPGQPVPPTVRRLELEHATPGPAAFDWDGRDEDGGVVPDGRYTVFVNDLPFRVEVDSTPPDLAWSYDDLRSEPRDPRGPSPGRVVATRRWHVVDPHLAGWSRRGTFFMEEGQQQVYEPERDAQGQIVYVGGVPKVKYEAGRPADVALKDAAVEDTATDPATVFTATDYAGNRSTIPLVAVPERLFLLSAIAESGDAVIALPLQSGPYLLSGPTSFALGETLRASPPNGPASLHFEYRPEGAGPWTASAPFSGRAYGVDFSLLGLTPSTVYQARFQGQGQASATSEDFRFLLCENTAVLSVDSAPLPNSDRALYDARLSAASPGDPIAEVRLEVRGPGGFVSSAVMARDADGTFSKTVVGPRADCAGGPLVFAATLLGESGRSYTHLAPCRTLLVRMPQGCPSAAALRQSFPFCAASPDQAYFNVDPIGLPDGSVTIEALGAPVGTFTVQGGQAATRIAVDAGALGEGRVPMTARHQNGASIPVIGPEADDDVSVGPEVPAGTAAIVDRTPAAVVVTEPAELDRLCTSSVNGRDVARLELAIGELGREMELGDDAAYRANEGPWIPLDVFQGTQPRRMASTSPSPLRWDVTGVVDGPYTVRLPLCDRAGHRTVVERRLTLSRTASPIELAVARTVFSPNGDGRADEGVASVTLQRPLRLTVDVAPAGSATRLRRLVADQPYGAGAHLFAWDGRDDGGQPLPDGMYAFMVTATDACGNAGRSEARIGLDTQPPAAALVFPTPGQAVATGTDLRGTATDLHLRAYELASGAGAAPTQWSPFFDSPAGVAGPSGLLGHWNAPTEPGPYALRLMATDEAENTTTATVAVTVAPGTLLDRLRVDPAFSPNGDGHGDTATVEYGLHAEATVTLGVRDAQGGLVRTLVPGLADPPGTHAVSWDGRGEDGAPASEGEYEVRIHAEAPPTPSQESSAALILDRTPPLVALDTAEGAVVAPGAIVHGSVVDAGLTLYAVSVRPPTGPAVEIGRGTASVSDGDLATLPSLADGPYVLSVSADDVAANRTIADRNVVIDTLAPVARLNLAGGAQRRGSTPIFVTGTATDGNLSEYVLEFGAGEEPASFVEIARASHSVAGGTLGPWAVSALPDGAYTLRLTVSDKAGHTAEARAPVTLDGTAPNAALTTPAEAAALNSEPLVRGTATDAALERWTLDLAPGTAGQAQQWTLVATGTTPVDDGTLATVAPLPPDGAHTLRLTVRDAAGNTSAALRTFFVDTEPPGAVSDLLAQAVRNGSALDAHLQWQAVGAADLAGYAVTRDGMPLGDGLVTSLSWVDAGPGEGTHHYEVRAVDRAGNRGVAAQAALRIDLTPPLAAIDSPAPGQPVSGSIDVRGTALSAGDFKEYRLLVGSGAEPTAWTLLQRSTLPVAASVLGAWTAVGDGPHVLALEAEDLSDNVARVAIPVVVDTAAPSAPVLESVNPGPAPDALAVTWQASPEVDVEGYLVYRDGRLANATGVVIGDLRPYLVPGPTYLDTGLADGPRCYQVVAMDRAGNLSPPSNTLCRLLDNRRPHAVVTAPPDGTRFEFPVRVLADTPDTDVVAVQFQISPHGQAAWAALGAADDHPPYETTLDPATLTAGSYDLRALAHDASGDDPAPVAITVTYGDTTAPAAPRGTAVRVDGREVHLSWTANGEPDLAGYSVWRDDVRVTPAPVATPAFVDTPPVPGRYVYQVTAVDAEGNESARSATAEARVYVLELRPPFPVVSTDPVDLPGRGALAGSTVEVAREGATVAQVVVSTEGPFTVPAVPLVEGLNLLTARGVDTAGNHSVVSDEAVLISNRPPAAVDGLEASVSGHAVDITWNPVADPDLSGYSIQRDGHDLTPVVPQAAAQSITASSTAGAGFEAALAFDGDPATAWMAAGGDRSPGWSVTFPAAVLVHAVHLRFPAAVPAYTVEARWQGRFLPLVRVEQNTATVAEHVLPTPFATDTVRVVLGGTPAGLSEVAVDKRALLPADQPSFHDEGVPDGTHTYEVRALDAFGAQGGAAQRAVPVGDVTAPSAPTGLAAVVEGADVLLTWLPAPEGDVTLYVVLRDGVEVASGAALLFRDMGLANGTYRYSVLAVDAVGNRSRASDPVLATVAVAPPAAPLLTAVALANGAVSLAWAEAGAARFTVLDASASGGPYAVLAHTGDTRGFIDGRAPRGAPRFYVVQAADARGNLSPFSNEASATPERTAPPAPPLLFRPTDAEHPIDWPFTSTSLDGRAEPGSLVSVDVGGTLRSVVEAGPPFQPIASDFLAEAAVSLVASPDGRRVALSMPGSPVALSWRDLESLESGTVTHPGGGDLFPQAFSPDGGRLAYRVRTCDGGPCRVDLYAADLLSGEVAVLENGAEDGDAVEWSRDGHFVAYTSTSAEGCSLWLLHLDGSPARQLAAAASCGRPRLSPDGTRVALTARAEGSGATQLWVVDAASTERRVLAEGVWPLSTPSWAHDGTRVAFTSEAAGALRARVVGLADPGVFDLGDPSEPSFDPQFDPEGGWLSLTSARSSPAGAERVLQVENLENGLRVEVARVSGEGPLRLHAWMRHRSIALALPDRVTFFGADGAFHLDSLRLGSGTNTIAARATDPDEGLTSAPSRPILLTVPADRFANLVLQPDALSTYPDIPGVGQSTLLKAQVRNTGLADAPDVLVRLTLRTADGGLSLARDARLPQVPAGGFAWVSTLWTPAGEGTYALQAQADPDDAVAEVREDDNDAARGVLVAPRSGLLVSVSSDRMAYPANAPVLLTLRVTNAGPDFAGSLATRVDSAGAPATVIDTRALSLGYGQTAAFTLSWNTGTTYAGTYAFVTRALGGPGEGRQAFTILPDVHVEVHVLPDQASVSQGQPAGFTVRVSNRSVNAPLEGASARLSVATAGGPEVFGASTPIAGTLPGGTWEGRLIWPAAGPPADYLATAAALADGVPLATASAPLRVRSVTHLVGTLAVPAHVVAGAPIPVAVAITNTGVTALPAEPFVVDLVDGATGGVLQHAAFALDLAPGERRETTVTLPAGVLPAARYPVLLRAPRLTVTLDRATVQIHGPLTAPSIDAPPAGARVASAHPTLVVNNAGAPSGSTPVYDFQVFFDAALTQPVPGATGVTQGSGRTSWRVAVNLLEDHTYYWRARAVDVVAVSPWTGIGTFTVDETNQPPSIPIPDSPDDASHVTSTQPLLTVKNAFDIEIDPLTYDFRLAEDAAMSTIVASRSDLPEGAGVTSWMVPLPLNEDQTYFWSARARDAINTTSWSDPSSFVVDAVNQSPTAPQPLRPRAGAEVATLLPEMAVANASDPEGDALTYRFELDLRPSFDSPQRQASPPLPAGAAETAWTPPLPLSDNTPYYWRAAASDGRSTSAFAGSTFFVNLANDPPTAPVALAPTTGEVVGTATPTLRLRNAVDLDRDSLTYDFVVTDAPGATVLAETSGVPQGVQETSWTVSTALPENALAAWRARAHDDDTAGPWSEPQQFRVNAVAEPPTQPRLVAPTQGAVIDVPRPALVVNDAASPDGLPLTYTFELYAVAANGDETRIASEEGVPERPGTTSWTAPQDLADGLHRWRARAVDAMQAGPWMDTASFTVAIDRPPLPPTAVQAVAGDSQVHLTWAGSPEPDVSGYHVRRSTVPGGPYETVGTVTAPTFTDNGLLNGVTVFYVVTALDVHFESAPSIEVSATPLPAVLAAEVRATPATLRGECVLGGPCAVGDCPQWIYTTIELPFDLPPDSIDRATIRLAGSVTPDPSYGPIVDRDGDGHLELEQRFARGDVAELLRTGPNALTVSGRAQGTPFQGSGVLEVAPLHGTLKVGPRTLSKGAVVNPGVHVVALLTLDACVSAGEVSEASVRLNDLVVPISVGTNGASRLELTFPVAAVAAVLPLGDAVEVRVTGTLRGLNLTGSTVIRVIP